MKKSRYFVFPAVCAAVSFILFLFSFYVIYNGSVLPISVGFVFIVPAFIFAIIAILGYSGHIPRIASNIVTGVLIPVLIVASLIAFLILIFISATTNTENPELYGRVYDMYYSEDSVYMQVFPEKIPDSADNVEFIYHPQFMQGAGKVYLRYSDADDIEKRVHELESEALWYGDKDSLSEWADAPSYIGGYDMLHDADGTEEYTIYLLNVENSYEPHEDAYAWWNHGTYTVVAISDNKDDIIYKWAWW